MSENVDTETPPSADDFERIRVTYRRAHTVRDAVATLLIVIPIGRIVEMILTGSWHGDEAAIAYILAIAIVLVSHRVVKRASVPVAKWAPEQLVKPRTRAAWIKEAVGVILTGIAAGFMLVYVL